MAHKLKVFTIVVMSMMFLANVSILAARKTHTIYVAGPTAVENSNWMRESKIIYRILKRETIKNGNTIEFFPKKAYRDSVKFGLRHKARRKLQRNCPSKVGLTSSYEDFSDLYESLLNLILLRWEQLAVINKESRRIKAIRNRCSVTEFEDEWDNRIHLKAYGRGGELLLSLINSAYVEAVGTMIVFDGDADSLSSVSTDSDDDHTIINITINMAPNEDHVSNEDSSEYWEIDSGLGGCTTKKFLKTAAAAVAIAAAIVALL